MDWAGIWDSIKNFFTVGRILDIVAFFAILIFGFIIVKILIAIIRKLLSKTKLEKITQKFIMSSIKLVLYVIYVLILLQTVGIAITGLIAALTAGVLAIGLALQDSLSNLANGIIIVSGKMFKEGDYISVAGVEGTVKNINLLRTTIVTVDNRTISLPNSQIVNNALTNFTANPTRRVDIMFAVAYETDIDKAQKIIFDVLKSDGRIKLDPAPFCKLKTLDDSSIGLFTNCWCDSVDYWDVYYYVMDKVFNEFKKNNISIPYSQVEVRLRNDKVKMPYDKNKLPTRVEKEVKQEKKFDILEEIKKVTHHDKKKAQKAGKALENAAVDKPAEAEVAKVEEAKEVKQAAEPKTKQATKKDAQTNKKPAAKKATKKK